MQSVLLVIHLIIALALICVVLLQRSEGGALGIGGGGGGAGGGIFSARGVGNALTRTTAFLALGFFITSISLTVLSTRTSTGGSVFDNATTSAPATTDAAKPAESLLPKLAPAKPEVPTVPVAP